MSIKAFSEIPFFNAKVSIITDNLQKMKISLELAINFLSPTLLARQSLSLFLSNLNLAVRDLAL